MKWTEQEIERVRNHPIATELGGYPGRRIQVCCPMPDHEDNTASFLVNENNSYHCFGCNVHGFNFIDFCTEIYRQKGVPEEDIFKKIMEEFTHG